MSVSEGKGGISRMKITYIGHSGFLVELGQTVLLFDYYQGEIPPVSEEKELYVFASHSHGDHFAQEVFALAEGHAKVHYVLSHDIGKRHVPEAICDRTVFLEPGLTWEDGPITVETLKSTDEGVAFLVWAEGEVIYHAGDLNYWLWEGETEEWNRKMEEDFKRFIEPLRGKEIDVAFIPLDPRQENHYNLGLDYFLDLTEAKKIYPMHCWEEYSIIDRWLSEHPDSPYRDRIVKICGRGEEFEQEPSKG